MLDLPARPGSGAETSARFTTPNLRMIAANAARHRPAGPGLAARVLIVTIGCVLVAIGLLYVTRLAAIRDTWLHNKLASAATAVEAFDIGGSSEPPGELSRKILTSLGVQSISIGVPPWRNIDGLSLRPLARIETVNLDSGTFFDGVVASFRTLFAAPGTVIRVTDTNSPDRSAITVTFDETRLIEAMWRLSRTFLIISLTVALVLTCVLWAALWHMVLRPVRVLTSNIIAFGELPQDASRVIAPSGRRDEIGRAETALAAMQASLAHELAQRKRLAELGMAVARINHDLRNMLSAAQLISDRLAAIPDPLAQRLAPRLVATLDRAVQFCQATLTYGGARKTPPDRQRFDLNELVHQVVEAARAESDGDIEYNIDIPPRFELYADLDHILRVLENLTRNGAQVLRTRGEGGRPKAMRFAAIRTEGVALIEISDTGPGFPSDQSDQIFEPFHKSTSPVGAGLGLAIAADLVARNGGAIALAPARADDFYCGARFLIKLPTPERAARNASRVPSPT